MSALKWIPTTLRVGLLFQGRICWEMPSFFQVFLPSLSPATCYCWPLCNSCMNRVTMETRDHGNLHQSYFTPECGGMPRKHQSWLQAWHPRSLSFPSRSLQPAVFQSILTSLKAIINNISVSCWIGQYLENGRHACWFKNEAQQYGRKESRMRNKTAERHWFTMLHAK